MVLVSALIEKWRREVGHLISSTLVLCKTTRLRLVLESEISNSDARPQDLQYAFFSKI